MAGERRPEGDRPAKWGVQGDEGLRPSVLLDQTMDFGGYRPFLGSSESGDQPERAAFARARGDPVLLGTSGCVDPNDEHFHLR